MADPLPSTPLRFKPIQHYLRTAVEHDKRDPIVAYYCRIFAMQKAMEIDKKSPDCKNFLETLLTLLEQTKKQMKDVYAIQSEVVGQAHVENYAIKLFHYADTEDRASHFGKADKLKNNLTKIQLIGMEIKTEDPYYFLLSKNVVKAFYTAGMLFDVLTNFGELPEDLERNRKYAKWKAAYIFNCLKTGETPHPGPLNDEMDEFGEGLKLEAVGNEGPYASQSQPEPYKLAIIPASQASGFPNGQLSSPSTSVSHPNCVTAAGALTPKVPQAGGAVGLKPDDYAKALKYCKFASSALQYEDAKTAIENLSKALNLLINGCE